MKNESVHPEASSELENAARWYDERREHLGDELLSEIRHARTLVRESPLSWPRHVYNTRRFVLRRFPFSVIYRIKGDEIHILAFAHHGRRPGYWRNRQFNDNS